MKAGSTRSRDNGKHRLNLRDRLVVLRPVGQNAERQRLRPANRLLARLPVSPHPRQLRYFRNPAAIGFLFDFDCVYGGILLSARSCADSAIPRPVRSPVNEKIRTVRSP